MWQKQGHYYKANKLRKMKALSLNISLYLVALGLQGQVQIGRVREFNSGKRPVAGVKIVFQGAVPTSSGEDGYFRLVFYGKKPGDIINAMEISKEGYELVNGKELEGLMLSRNISLGMDIIVAKKGVLDAAKKEYYSISDKALLANFNKQKEKLRDKLKMAEIDQKRYEQLLIGLYEQSDKQREGIGEYADKFARMNLDDMNSLQEEALNLFKTGDVTAAIKKLEQTNLVGRLKNLQDEKQEIIKGILFQAELYELNSLMGKAEELYDKLSKLDSVNMEISRSASDFYKRHSNYIKILHLYPKIVKNANAKPWQKADAYGSAAFYSLLLNRFTDVEAHTLTCLTADSNQIWIFTNLAIAYIFRDKWEDAKTIYIRLKKKFNNDKSFKAALLQDLEYLESYGITHPDMPKVRAFLGEK
jgi:tetratricopeptide (TPR) repeat protein